MTNFRIDDVITNGSSAGKVIEVMSGSDPRWRTPGIRMVNISLEQFGGQPGVSSFVPDYLLSGWRLVPFEWQLVIGGGAEERYVWSKDYRRLQREVRPAATAAKCPECGRGGEGTVKVLPTVDGIRGHRVTTPEQDEARRRATMEHMQKNPITAEDVARLLGEVGP